MSKKFTISVSKSYLHRGRFILHRPKTKQHWFRHFIKIIDGRMKHDSERINVIQAMYYKTQKYHRLNYFCFDCSRYFFALVKSKKQEVDCPYCE